MVCDLCQTKKLESCKWDYRYKNETPLGVLTHLNAHDLLSRVKPRITSWHTNLLAHYVSSHHMTLPETHDSLLTHDIIFWHTAYYKTITCLLRITWDIPRRWRLGEWAWRRSRGSDRRAASVGQAHRPLRAELSAEYAGRKLRWAVPEALWGRLWFRYWRWRWNLLFPDQPASSISNVREFLRSAN